MYWRGWHGLVQRARHLQYTRQSAFNKHIIRHFSSEAAQRALLSEDTLRVLNGRILAIESRHAGLTKVASLPDASPNEIMKVNKELSKLEELIHSISRLREKQKEMKNLQELLKESAREVDICKMASEELVLAAEEEKAIQQELLLKMLPKDEADSRSCILEVRAGTGGDEASLFAMDLFKMYENFAQNNFWKFEAIDITETSLRGYKEASASITGSGAYGKLKFESGVHRVQRVPITEKSGRVHTSAASVAILPQADETCIHSSGFLMWQPATSQIGLKKGISLDPPPTLLSLLFVWWRELYTDYREGGQLTIQVYEVDVQIRNEDLRIDTYRAGGAGGQHVNTTSSAVRITHIPSGLSAAIQDQRSQHQNKARAMSVLRARLYEVERKKLSASRSELRQLQIGSGDRSERIRTYNFPQGRVTDHRAGITTHSIERFMEGEGLDMFIDALKMKEEAAALASLAMDI